MSNVHRRERPHGAFIQKYRIFLALQKWQNREERERVMKNIEEEKEEIVPSNFKNQRIWNMIFVKLILNIFIYGYWLQICCIYEPPYKE